MLLWGYGYLGELSHIPRRQIMLPWGYGYENLVFTLSLTKTIEGLI
jgi:hypothetical protein